MYNCLKCQWNYIFLPERGKDNRLRIFIKQASQFFQSFVQYLISIHLIVGSIFGHLRGLHLILDQSNFFFSMHGMKPNASRPFPAVTETMCWLEMSYLPTWLRLGLTWLLFGEERCVTSLKTAAKETTLLATHFNIV